MIVYLVGTLVFGFVAGLLARAIMPGTQKMGCLATSILGIAGSYVGGFLASFLFHAPRLQFSPTGLIGSVIGALALLILFAVVRRVD